MGKRKLLKDMRRTVHVSDAIKQKIDKLIAEGKLKPTVFVRENSDGTPCMEIETKVVAVLTKEKTDG